MRIFVGMIGWEAQVWLRHCLEGGILEDPVVDYLAGRVEEMDAAALLEALGILRKRLAEIEVSEGTDPGERIRVTKDYRIVLPDRFEAEIHMRPLVKTVFLLFLHHPEGIRFGELPAYREELLDLYLGISRRLDRSAAEASIDRLIDPRDNSIHEKAANLAAALSKYFPPERMHAYTLTGKAGAPKRIRLDRSLVEWE